MQANYVSGWREILARVFDGFDVQYGLTPDWLINPDTNRRLKLDLFFPQIAVAIRFVGIEGGGKRRRKSDEEVASEEDREEARASVCRQNGVVLISIAPDDDPRTELRKLELGLARSTSQMAQAQTPQSAKLQLMPLLSGARRRAGEFTTKLVAPERLNLYAEMWRDREATLVAAEPVKPRVGPLPAFRPGMRVEHERFGEGEIIGIEPDLGDVKITVDFVESGVHTFLASLVSGAKLRIVAE